MHLHVRAALERVVWSVGLYIWVFVVADDVRILSSACIMLARP